LGTPSAIDRLAGVSALQTWEELEYAAEVSLARGNLQEAEANLLYALSLAEEFGQDDSRYVFTLEQLVEVTSQMKRLPVAEAYLTQVLHAKIRNLGGDNLEIAIVLNSLAGLKYNQGKFRECEELCERSLELHTDILGENDLETAAVAKNLAIVYHTQRKYSQAEPLYKLALRVCAETLGPDHEEVIQIRQNYEKLLNKPGAALAEKILEGNTPILQRLITVVDTNSQTNLPASRVSQSQLPAASILPLSGTKSMAVKRANPCLYRIKSLAPVTVADSLSPAPKSP
jgi:tetratricopeptide (TPR) repeat protein